MAPHRAAPQRPALVRLAWLTASLAVALAACGDDSASDGTGAATPRLASDGERPCAVRLFYTPDGVASPRPSVVGSFNDWDPSATVLRDTNGDGTYQALIWPEPGQHTYLIQDGGQRLLDAYNPLTLFERGDERSLLVVEDCRQPALTALEITPSADGVLTARLRFLRGYDGPALDPASVRAELTSQHIDGALPEVTVASADPDTGEVVLSAQGVSPGKYTLHIEASASDGATAAPITRPFWADPAPFDWRDALIYQVFVDRFQRGSGSPLATDVPITYYRGGDLDGVTRALEDGYFQDLGANVLWLSPVYENPEGTFLGRVGEPAEPYHGYWPSDPKAVETRFGGEAALERLIRAAHDRGIRVILDTVLNHLHVEHPYYREDPSEARFNHPDADCICGLTCSWGTHMETCWFDPFLADLNWHNPQVVEQMTVDAVDWVERFDLDGLRLDAVPMMPRLAMRHLRDGLRRRFGDHADALYLLGETYTSRGNQPLLRYYLGPHSLSGQFDFPVMWALRDALAGRIPMTDLDAEVIASQSAWIEPGAVMAPLLGNHDVPRFVSDVNDDPIWEPHSRTPERPDNARPYTLLKMAWAFLLTQPGAPVIYYGDEIGMEGAYDPDNRRNMRFGDAVDAYGQQVMEHVRRLGHARTCSEALRRGDRQTLLVHESFYVYGRDAGDGHPALVLLNRADLPRTMTFDLPDAWTVAPDADWRDLFGADVEVEGRTLSLSIPPGSAAVLMTRCIPPSP